MVKRRRLKRSVVRVLLSIPFIILILYIMTEQPPKPKIMLAPKDVPAEYIPIYQAAEREYGVPWELLAAHHRVETKFSRMDPLLSPAGAEGHLQFMPCTFVGWSHPTCSGLGKGDIPHEEKINPAVISKYGGYGVDANGDGKADPFDLEDAVFSAAHYLKANGAADGELERAIFAYNHSETYVNDVMHFLQEYSRKQ